MPGTVKGTQAHRQPPRKPFSAHSLPSFLDMNSSLAKSFKCSSQSTILFANSFSVIVAPIDKDALDLSLEPSESPMRRSHERHRTQISTNSAALMESHSVSRNGFLIDSSTAMELRKSVGSVARKSGGDNALRDFRI